MTHSTADRKPSGSRIPSRRDVLTASATALAGAGLATLPSAAGAQEQPAIARIVTVQGDDFDNALRNFTENGVPRLKGMPGITGIYVISDPEEQLYRIITFWENEEVAEQAYQAMAAPRQAVQATGMSFELKDYRVDAYDEL